MCIGAVFAIYEMCLTLFYIVKRYVTKSAKRKIPFNPVGAEVLFSKR